MKRSMKTFMKMLALVLAFIMVIDTSASASGIIAFGTGTHSGDVSGTHTGDPTGTHTGDPAGTHTGDPAGTHTGDPVGTHTGDPAGTHTGDPTGTHTGDSTTEGTDDGKDANGNKAQVVAVTVKGAAEYTIGVDEEVTVTVNVIAQGDPNYTVNWSLSNDTAAIVKQSGKSCTVKGVHGGTATLTATVGSKSASVKINVQEHASGMYFAQDEYTSYLKHKDDMSKELVLVPATATDEITYDIAPADGSKKKYATVDANGVVTMKKVGSVILTAATENGIFAQTKITIEEGNPVKKISLNTKKVDIPGIGETATLTATVESKKGGETTDDLVWSVGKSKVQVVEVEDNEDGTATITAIAVGKAKVTVQASSGKKATANVTTAAPLTGIAISVVSGASDNGETYPLKKVTLKAEREPEENTDKLTWSTGDKKVAAVSGKKDGTAVVSVKAKTVTEPQEVTITATGKNGVSSSFVLTINPSQVTGINAIDGPAKVLVGAEESYSAEVVGGSDEDITWVSSSAKVLSIDKDGNVVALKAGKATIKASVTLSNGKVQTVTKKVEVAQPVTNLSLTKPVLTTIAGKQKAVSFKAVKDPKNADKKSAIVYSLGADAPDGVVIDAKKGKVTVPASVTAGTEFTVTAACEEYDVSVDGTVKVLGSKSKVAFNPETLSGTASVVKKSLNANQGAIVDLKPTVTPAENQDFEEFTYKVSKKGIVSVSEDGILYALHPGSTKVTVTASSGAKATLTVKVTASKVDSGDAGTHTGTDSGKDQGTHTGTDEGKDKK